VKGIGEEATATLAGLGATQAKSAGTISALGSLVSGAGSVASKWMTYKSTFGSSDKTGPTTYDESQDW
jgi:hypothetical protein